MTTTLLPSSGKVWNTYCMAKLRMSPPLRIMFSLVAILVMMVVVAHFILDATGTGEGMTATHTMGSLLHNLLAVSIGPAILFSSPLSFRLAGGCLDLASSTFPPLLHPPKIV